MRKVVLLGLLLITTVAFSQTKLRSTYGKLEFFSSTPVEDIHAYSTKARSVVRTNDSAIVVIVPIQSFTFKKRLMQEHFNENYMESKKFPKATFKGKYIGTFDLKKNGTYNLKFKGKLKIHGVEKDREFDGKLVVKDGKASLTGKFKVKLADHNIDIPKVVTKKIAEVVDVTVDLKF